MIGHPVGPRSDEEKEICNVFILVYVWCLVEDAVDAAYHGVVGECHLIRNVQRRMLVLLPD